MSQPSVEDVRTKGQVWTPIWVAAGMARFLKPNLSRGTLLDPAVGPGVLLRACERESQQLKDVMAFEIDRNVVSAKRSQDDSSYPADAIKNLIFEDFIHSDVPTRFDAVIANPPYLRHHRIPPRTKSHCQKIATEVIGERLDARAGIQVFFLLKALSLLKSGGRLSFILPSDVVEGVFSRNLWNGIASRYKIHAVLTFEEGACAFPGVDTNAFIVFIENTAPSESYSRLYWSGKDDRTFHDAIGLWMEGGDLTGTDLREDTRDIQRGVEEGLTRQGTNSSQKGTPFTDLARVIRGVATGDNDYFCFTSDRILEAGLSQEFFVRCIGRTRDLLNPRVDSRLLSKLDEMGRETFLLSVDSKTKQSPALRRYLRFGEQRGVPEGALVKARSTWYTVERRIPPPILFTYLGRRDNRFVLNVAKVVPLTGFLCVYPMSGVSTPKLLAALNHPATWSSIKDIGKSYGGGAVKVEPGNLRRLIIPEVALRSAGLRV